MNRTWKISLYLFFFGALTFLGAILLTPRRDSFSKAEILGSQTQIQAFVEPDDGRTPLLDRIAKSERQILVEVYIISDPEIISGLVEADKQGIDVRVILEERPFGGNNLNQKSKKTLEENGVEVRWSPKRFRFTHQKSMTFDGEETCILNANLSTTSFSKNREFSVCTTGVEEVQTVTKIFWADWNDQNLSVTQANLVVSPIDSRAKIRSLLQQAEGHIEIVMEVLNDDEIVDLLVQKAAVIPVRVLLPTPEQLLADREAAEKISQGGGGVKKLSKPYLHAKLIIVDGERAYLGSVNLSENSFDANRELGIIVSQRDVVARFQAVFENDWEKASNYN